MNQLTGILHRLLFSINTRQSYAKNQISYTALHEAKPPQEIFYPGLKLPESDMIKKARKLMDQRIA